MICFTDHLKCLVVKIGQTFIEHYSISALDKPFTRHIKTDGCREPVQKVRRSEQPGLFGTRQAQDKETLIILTVIRDNEDGTKKKQPRVHRLVLSQPKCPQKIGFFLKMVLAEVEKRDG